MTFKDDGQALVAFVGAGASAMPPSRLPTWNGFNNLLLESLCERLADYSGHRQPTDKMLALFRERRDNSSFFPPDFQAQLIEEEVGEAYFRVWQSLETHVYGPVHATLAELATRGRIAAIVTTNFDRLIEGALTAAGQKFAVYHDAESFAKLSESLDTTDAVLPVIKIHGSIEDTGSLIDTLKQRVAGRPPVLTSSLAVLLTRHPWLFLGFSGADFSYDAHYLGILDAAPEAKGFTFLAREGTPLQDGVRVVADAYGREKASIVSGDLTTWLAEAFALPPPVLPWSKADEAGIPQGVQDKVRQWAGDLGPMSVVNIVCAMLKSAGLEAETLWLLRKTWKSYRSSIDTLGKSYDRYNYNYGLSLLHSGFVRNDIALAEDMSNMIEWRVHADQNAMEFFSRSFHSGELLVAGAQAAAVLAYRGEASRAVGLAADITDKAHARNAPLERCDVALACVPIYDILQVFEAVGQLHQCLALAKSLGDEPRRALLSVHLGRFLTYAGAFAEADAFLSEGDRIATRLDLRRVALAGQAARGLWLADSNTSIDAGLTMLSDVANVLRSRDDEPLFTKLDLGDPAAGATEVRGRNPDRCRVLLDLNRVAMIKGDLPVMEQTLDELDALAPEHFTGYAPHYFLAYALCLLNRGAGGHEALVADLLGRAHRVADSTGNPRMVEAATELARQAGLSLGHSGGT